MLFTHAKDLTHFSDTELLVRFIDDQDADAFEELVKRHVPMVTATARRVLGSSDEVHDAVQATMFALARSVGNLRRKQSLAAWLHRAAYTSAIEIRRVNYRWKKKMDHFASQAGQTNPESRDEAADPFGNASLAELKDVLDEELAQLPEKYRVALVLCDLEGLSLHQAARRLGHPKTTVSERVNKARRMLRRRLTRRGITASMTSMLAALAINRTLDAMPQAAVGDLVTKATLYAAGESAGKLGVSNSVIWTANKVTLALLKGKTMRSLIAALLIVGFSSSTLGLYGLRGTASGEMIFRDDFRDGSVTNDQPLLKSGEPVQWQPLYGANLHVADASLVVSGDSVITPTAYADTGTTIDNASVRSQVRLVQGDAVALGVRYDPSGGFGNGYFGGIARNGNVFIGISSGPASSQPAEFIEIQPTNLIVDDNELIIQLDAIGDELSLRVWEPGAQMPAEPLVRVRDDRGLPGNSVTAFALGASASVPESVEAYFRYVHFADTVIIPEPCHGAVSLLGAFGISAACMRKRRFYRYRERT